VDKLAIERFGGWQNDDKKKFNIALVTVRDRVVADQHCVTATFATMYSDSHSLAVKLPRVLLSLCL
jgi:hypothetical protein